MGQRSNTSVLCYLKVRQGTLTIHCTDAALCKSHEIPYSRNLTMNQSEARC
jgi:hypothetical protein